MPNSSTTRSLQQSAEANLTILSEQAHKLIAIQRKKYIESMTVKRKVILQGMAQVRAGADGQPDIGDNLFQQIHQLAGSAGSYGFDRLGQAASVIDRYLIARKQQAFEMSELESYLNDLLLEIDNIISQNR